MPEQCSYCGQELAVGERTCPFCEHTRSGSFLDRHTNLLIFGVAGFAFTGIGILIAIIYFSGFTATSRPITPSQEEVDTPVSATAPNTAITHTSPMAVDETTLAPYAAAMGPLLAEIGKEMESVKLDIRTFVKTANQTSNPRDTRRVTDNFREQMKGHKDQLLNINNSLKGVTAPTLFQSQHIQLSKAVAKYIAAVDSYISGLAVYSFSQISASQKSLEAADLEIKQSATNFQSQLKDVVITTQ